MSEHGARSPTEVGARVAVVVAILVVLLAVVAIGASSSIPQGAGGHSDHAASVIFTLLTVFGALVLLCCLALVVLALAPARQRTQKRPPRVEGRKLAALLVLLVSVAVGADIYLTLHQQRRSASPHPFAVAPAADQPPRTTKPPVAIDHHVLIASVIVIGAVVVVLAIAMTVRRARLRRASGGDHFGAEVLIGPPALDLGTPADAAGVLAGITIADPELEPDPRRAVIVAYERMHDALSRSGYPREPYETPHEYLSRVLEGARPAPAPAGLGEAGGETPREHRATRQAAITTLTELFSVARYSSLEMDEGDRRAAIDALVRIAVPARADHDDHPVGAATPR